MGRFWRSEGGTLDGGALWFGGPPTRRRASSSADGLGLGLPAGRGHAKPCRPGSSRLPPPRAPGPSLGFAVGRILAPGGLGASGWRTPESSGRSLKALRASAPRGPLLVLETQPAQGSEPGGAGFRSTETGGQIRRPSEPEAELPNSRCWREDARGANAKDPLPRPGRDLRPVCS